MLKLSILWSVFTCRRALDTAIALRHSLSRISVYALRQALRCGPLPLYLVIARLLCTLRVVGRRYHLQNAVASENFRCLTGQPTRINAAWTAVRRRMLEEAATWGQNRTILRQIQHCAEQLDETIAPLHRANVPVILAPLHCVSDVLAATIGASVTPGRASVVVSASAALYNQRARALGGVQLDYCSIHQENRALAGDLMSLITDVADGKRNMIIFPDISPDYTLQAEGALAAKLPCRLFGRAAKLHNGVVRLSRTLAAHVVFYSLSYDRRGLHIHIHAPIAAPAVANVLPGIIEHTLLAHPHDWLLWHSHSLYFINH